MKKSFWLAFVLAAFTLPTLASAADFDPDYLISDAEMTNFNALDLNDIQKFLDRQPGILKSYIAVDKENNLKTASQTFYETAQKWMINPKYLMVLVQKEMSLLSHPAPEQRRLDWATGYGCPDSGGCDSRWEGFYKQVNSAAAQTRYYMDNIREFNYQPGKSSNIDGTMVTPKTTATAGLYNYTPHIKGNLSFWNLWNTYFSKRWPDGTFLKDGATDDLYLISGGKKRPITSKALAFSLGGNKTIEATSADLAEYEAGAPLKFQNFSLLKSPTGEIYLIVGEKKRKFESAAVFTKMGLKDDELIDATMEDLNIYSDSLPITASTAYATGALVQDKKTKQIYYVIGAEKKPVLNKEIQDFNFKGLKVKIATPEELDNYLTTDPVGLPDGTLVKSKKSPAVYVISNGKRLTFTSGKVFTNLGYKFSNMIVVSQETLDIHPLGENIVE